MLIKFDNYDSKERIYNRLKFSVIQYKYINRYLEKDEYIFIILKDIQADFTVSYTRYENYILNTKREYLKGSTIKKKAQNICLMLNYLFIQTRKANSITEITWEMLRDFFDYYINEVNKKLERKRGKKDTMNRCKQDIVVFMKNYIQAYSRRLKFSISIEDLYFDKVVYDIKNGGYKTVIAPNFTDKYPKDRPKKFREFPESYFDLLISVAKEFMPEMVFPLSLQAYAGLREGEVCNLSMGSLKMVEGIGYVSSVEIDFTEDASFEEFPTTDVGSSKVNRKQKVYTPFVEEINKRYIAYLSELEIVLKRRNQTFELGNKKLPLFYNKWGKPLRMEAYCSRLKKLFNEHFLPTLYRVAQKKKTNNAIDFAYYEKYRSEYPGAHCLRHWFTMHLVIDGLSEGEIQSWRGDTKPESARYYYHNQGELKRKFIETTLTYQNIIWSEIYDEDNRPNK